MADREPFPYSEEWRADLPMLFELGVVQAIAKHITSNHPHNSNIGESLHCQVVWSEWDWYRDGARHLRIKYKYPSILFDENEIGDIAADDELFGLEEDALQRLASIADTRPVDIWNIPTAS